MRSCRSLNDIVGRADLLRQRDITLGKTAGLDLSFLTTYAGECGSSKARIAQATHSNGPVLDDGILADAAVAEAIATGSTVERSYDIVNTDRCATLRHPDQCTHKRLRIGLVFLFATFVCYLCDATYVCDHQIAAFLHVQCRRST